MAEDQTRDSAAPPQVPDAARAVLSRVRAAARAGQPATTQQGGSAPSRFVRSTRVRPAGFSGPGPDDRDPAPVGRAWASLVSDQGWQRAMDAARIHGMWQEIVGRANAEHAQPESFDPATGALVVRTSSTAWAEQLRQMLPTLRAVIDAHVGSGVVRDIRVVGPAPPPVGRGRLRVRGRGPRDTYG